MSVESHPGHRYLRALRNVNSQRIAYEAAKAWCGEVHRPGRGTEEHRAAADARLEARERDYAAELDKFQLADMALIEAFMASRELDLEEQARRIIGHTEGLL